MQYDQPTNTNQLIAALDGNVGVSAEMLAAIEGILNLQPNPQINVAKIDDSGAIVAPEGDAHVVILDDRGAVAGQKISINIPSEILGTAGAYIFNSDADLTVRFNTVERVIAMGNGNDFVEVLGDKNTTLDGGHGNDTLITSGGDDLVTGGLGNDSISTGAGNDTIISGEGNDTIDGGTGFDIIQAGGLLETWNIEIVDGAIVLTRGADSITAKNVEFIQLEDAAISVVATEEEATALRLYEALLGRTADREGAEYWVGDVNKDGGSTHGVAASFLESDEFLARGDLSDEQFVELLYTHALHRDAEDEGLKYWVEGMDKYGHTRAEVAIAIVGSTEAADVIVTVQILDGLV